MSDTDCLSAEDRESLLPTVHRLVLEWYARHKRDLPWRDITNPYHVLVSEIMLQQTQVDRVIPKYHAWLERYPTLEALATAPAAEVIRDWAGLGYNRRAIHLQRLAQQVVVQNGGRLPDSVMELLALPGIGRYTAGAVACFGFRQAVATVDTNIRRVLARVFCGQLEPALSEGRVFALAESVLPVGEAYNWNQALMDLGATICVSGLPACPRCPLAAVCKSRLQFDALRYPDGMAQTTLWDGTLPPAVRRPKASRTRPKQESFSGSRRYFRGRIVETLRLLGRDETLDLASLGTGIKPDFDSADPGLRDWLTGLVRDLERDGLIRTRLREPHSIVAEERAVYSTANTSNEDAASTTEPEWETLRVSLP